ncbi:MAG TPA: GyrI-like domain-containing protein, partial [Candidatus Marinimicrobia bacterium]|nr:GyrI-like domain-containing protein [Candidatus Neomarinimicrobiota bacterium]
VIVEVPPMNYLMVDGEGGPAAESYQQAIEALYGLSFTVKFDVKKKGIGPDYTVMPLEGLWWAKDMTAFSSDRKDEWQWKMMIMQPDHVTAKHVNAATKQLREKKNPPALDKIRFESYHEGPSVQILHIGPYDDEGPTIAQMHKFIDKNGYQLHMKHHEIYLSDPRRSKPEKLKTVLRQPVTKA